MDAIIEKACEIFIIVLIIVAILFAVTSVFAFPFMWLWNYLMPDIFGLPELAYWKAYWLMIFVGFFFVPGACRGSKS